MGADPTVGQGQVDRGQTGQRAGRDNRRKAQLEPFQLRRCLLPVDGYFEWESRPSGKQPVYYSTCDGDLFCLAGLWETWAAPMQVTEPELPGLELGQAESETLRTFTVITTTPNRLAKRVHDRMPVIVHRMTTTVGFHPKARRPILSRYYSRSTLSRCGNITSRRK